MPWRAKRPCKQPGCPGLTNRGPYCDVHKGKATAEKRRWMRRHDEQRGSAAKRGYGGTWRKLRLMILSRDPVCRWKTGCTRPSVEVDHIIPLRDGGTNEEENLQGLCRQHHDLKTDQDVARRKRARKGP